MTDHLPRLQENFARLIRINPEIDPVLALQSALAELSQRRISDAEQQIVLTLFQRVRAMDGQYPDRKILLLLDTELGDQLFSLRERADSYSITLNDHQLDFGVVPVITEL
jgi:hypothetical protein